MRGRLLKKRLLAAQCGPGSRLVDFVIEFQPKDQTVRGSDVSHHQFLPVYEIQICQVYKFADCKETWNSC